MENEFEAKEILEKERKNIKSLDDLMNYIQNIRDNYDIGYDTAPRAIAQAALATSYYLADMFDITGFQAGFVMWDFIKDWSFRGNKCGLKIVNYDDMLYPQYNHKFQKISSNLSSQNFVDVRRPLLSHSFRTRRASRHSGESLSRILLSL